MTEESKGAVLAAMGANFGIAVGKFVGGALTGSAAMFAEAGHSVADTVNQVFLLVGINLADTEPDEAHPHGYGKEPFFWSFMAAIFIFVAGAAFSFYEGARTLLQEHDHHRSASDLAVACVSRRRALRDLLVGHRRPRPPAQRAAEGLARRQVRA
jgi:cation diffusion facilitator family transporter